MIGQLLAWITLVPLGMFLVELGLVINRANSFPQFKKALLVFIGQLINETISYTIKDYFIELRPHGSERSDYGMPSSHAQFMGFILGMFQHILDLTIFGHLPNFVAYLMAVFGSGLICWSRIYLKYHDTRQVLVGFFFGLFLGSLWSSVINVFVPKQKRKCE